MEKVLFAKLERSIGIFLVLRNSLDFVFDSSKTPSFLNFKYHYFLLKYLIFISNDFIRDEDIVQFSSYFLNPLFVSFLQICTLIYQDSRKFTV